MVRREVLLRRLQKLDEYLRILHRLQRYSRDKFLSDPERYGSAERFLQLAIETLTDLGDHVIADLELGVVDWYSDVPRLLHSSRSSTWRAVQEKARSLANTHHASEQCVRQFEGIILGNQPCDQHRGPIASKVGEFLLADGHTVYECR